MNGLVIGYLVQMDRPCVNMAQQYLWHRSVQCSRPQSACRILKALTRLQLPNRLVVLRNRGFPMQ